ncbi:hypothetical protein Tco_0422815 [Tanacetum coccineum]
MSSCDQTFGFQSGTCLFSLTERLKADNTNLASHLSQSCLRLTLDGFPFVTVKTDEVFSTWMAFGGNTRDLGSFRKETDKITYLHQIHEEVLFIERGDSVAGIKQRHRDLSNDGVRDLAMASGLQRDAVTTISLYIQNRF